MNNNLLSFVFLLACLFIYSGCFGRFNFPTFFKSIDPTFELIWNVRLGNGNSQYIKNHTLLYDNFILFVGLESDSLGNKITAFDKKTGKLLWEDYFHTQPNVKRKGITNVLIQKELLIGVNGPTIFAYNLEKRRFEWVEELAKQFNENANVGFSVLGDHLYVGVGLGNVPFYQKSSLVRFNIFSGSKEIILSSSSNKGAAFYCPPALYLNPINGDSILLFKMNFLNNKDAFIPCDLVAFNLSTHKILWQKQNFSPTWSAKDSAPHFLEDKVIITSDWHVYCFDIISGDQIWKYQLRELCTPINGVISICDPVLYEGKYIVTETLGIMHCIDALSGKAFWINKKGSVSSSKRTLVHKDLIINTTGSGLLRAYDLNSGLTFLSKTGLNQGNFLFDVIYDDQTDTYYTTDFRHLYAFKINK